MFNMENKNARVLLGNENYRTTIYVGDHEVVIDEPVELGGSNEGATATHFLLASLGACTAVTMRMYAERKQWELGEITINLSIDQENRNGQMFSEISQDITFSEELSPDQHARMLVIADKCPIHKTLMGEVSFASKG